MLAFVLIDPALAQSRDLSFAHTLLNERGFGPETLRDDGHIDLNDAFFKLDHRHCKHLALVAHYEEGAVRRPE